MTSLISLIELVAEITSIVSDEGAYTAILKIVLFAYIKNLKNV